MPISLTAVVIDLAVVAGAFLAGVALMLAVTLPIWMADPNRAPELEPMLAGQFLAHWSCSADEQRRFLRRERERLGRTLARRLAFVLALGVVLALLLILITYLNRNQPGAISPVTAIGVAALVAGMGFGAAPLNNAYLNAHSLWARFGPRRQRTGGDVYIGPLGAYVFGEYFTLGGGGTTVSGAALEAGDPPCLVFETKRPGSRGSTIAERITVPVAAGHQAEAQALLAQFAAAPGASL